MAMTYRAYGRLFALAAAIALWAALAIQFQIATAPYAAQGRWSIAAIAAFLSSYAVLTDVLAALSLSVAIVGSPRAPWPSLMTAIAIYLVIVFGLYRFGLTGDLEARGRAELAQIALHCAAPAVFVSYWLLFVPKGHARWFAPLLWLIYPIVLFGAALWQGRASANYPFSFLDVATLGYADVARHCALLLAAFLLSGIVFRAIDRLFRPLAMA